MPPYNPDDYEPVELRIEKFWDKYPNGRIETELCSPPANFEHCRYVARVFAERTDEKPIASGYAFELAGSGPVNRTNHEENCETSAIGRALANAGFAPKGKRPSRQEMAKASRGPAPRGEATNAPQPAPERATAPASQPQGPPVTPDKLKRMHAMARDLGWADGDWKPTVYKDYQVAHVNELSVAQADAVIARFAKKLQQRPLIDAVVPPPGEPSNDQWTR